jgi:hypothetical protein
MAGTSILNELKYLLAHSNNDIQVGTTVYYVNGKSIKSGKVIAYKISITASKEQPVPLVVSTIQVSIPNTSKVALLTKEDVYMSEEGLRLSYRIRNQIKSA